MAKNYVTPHGFNKLTSELEHLMKIERPEVTKVVQWAASLGDRSENADYKYGKKRLREIDKRIRFLTKRIDESEVVDPVKISASKVQFGATVEVLGEDDQTKVYCIVGVDESNPSINLISWQSPIGRSLLGKEEGDEIIVRTPMGEIEFEIMKIDYIEIDFGE